MSKNIGFDLRSLIIKNYHDGNRKMLSSDMVVEEGFEECNYIWYNNQMNALYASVKDYCIKKHTASYTDEERDKARSDIFAKWKGLFQYIEKDENSHDIVPTEDDVIDIVTCCQSLVKSKVNTKKEKDFANPSKWATNPPAQFRRKVETMLGIKAANVDIMSDDERDYNKCLRKLVNKRGKKQGKIDSANKDIKSYKEDIKTVDDSTKKYLEKKIKSLEVNIDKNEKSIESLTKEIDELEKIASESGFKTAIDKYNELHKKSDDAEKVKAEAKTEDAKQSEQDAEKAEAKTKGDEVKAEAPSKSKTATKSKTTTKSKTNKAKTATKVA